ncbi:MAG: hypothetical protein ACOWWR_05880 [Eubacteriales bacterium]
MDPINEKQQNSEVKIEKEEFTDLIKIIAIYEAKSALAKLKLLKCLTEKGVRTLGKVVDKTSNLIDKKLQERDNK